ncbi:MAG: phosphatase PAP2 family protein [Bacteroidales bacterium]|nr:phosphatase PAP2 family protein [Bacteroidales bacterium]
MLEELDQQLFYFINSRNSEFLDFVMYSMSRVLIWVPLYIAIFYALGRKYGRKMFFILLFIILSVVLADQTSVFIKNSFQRLRPCHAEELQGMVHLVKGHCGGKFGFVSSHAANSFSIALLSLLLIKRRWFSISILIWAAVVGYSRIYLGVHYPGDVICGSLLGASIGWLIHRLYLITDNKFLRKRYEMPQP